MSEQLTRAEQDLAAKILEHSPRNHISTDDLRALVRLARVLASARTAYTAASITPSPRADVEALGRRVVEAQKALLVALDRLP
jgi:hypothetical protein